MFFFRQSPAAAEVQGNNLIINTMLTKDFFRQLEQPFPISDISVRIGTKKKDNSAALPLFYLQADAVRHRLDVACASEAAEWGYDFEMLAVTEKTLAIKATITITKDGKTISRSSIGEETFAKEDNTEVYKSAETDAFKRAAARFGVGGYLRTLEKMWFPLNERGYFADAEEEIVKRVYEKSGITVTTTDFSVSIQETEQALLRIIDELKPSLKKPCVFLEEAFVAEYEKKKGLKKGAWWSVQTIMNVPVREYTLSELHTLAELMLHKVNEDNFLEALVLSKALPIAAQYPDHFGRKVQAKVQQAVETAA